MFSGGFERKKGDSDEGPGGDGTAARGVSLRGAFRSGANPRGRGAGTGPGMGGGARRPPLHRRGSPQVGKRRAAGSECDRPGARGARGRREAECTAAGPMAILRPGSRRCGGGAPPDRSEGGHDRR